MVTNQSLLYAKISYLLFQGIMDVLVGSLDAPHMAVIHYLLQWLIEKTGSSRQKKPGRLARFLIKSRI